MSLKNLQERIIPKSQKYNEKERKKEIRWICAKRKNFYQTYNLSKDLYKGKSLRNIPVVPSNTIKTYLTAIDLALNEIKVPAPNIFCVISRSTNKVVAVLITNFPFTTSTTIP